MSTMIKKWSRVIASKLGWRVDKARDFAISLLTEVNDHTLAAAIRTIIEEERKDK